MPLLARRLPIEEGLAGEIEPSQRRHAAVEVQLESLNALLCILPLPATHLEDRLRGRFGQGRGGCLVEYGERLAGPRLGAGCLL